MGKSIEFLWSFFSVVLNVNFFRIHCMYLELLTFNPGKAIENVVEGTKEHVKNLNCGL